MPRRNGTGPMGIGAMTGGGFGLCTGLNVAKKYGAGLGVGLGLGLACRHGFGRGFGRRVAANQGLDLPRKELLERQKSILKDRLEAIDKQLENL